MTRTFLLILLLISATLTAVADDATLHWKNGDSLSGTLLKADENTLTWRSSMFTDPLQIELSYLDKVNFPESTTSELDETELQILMRNGDSLSGQLKSISDSTMSFESQRFGKFEVARDQILGIQRAEKSGLIYSGPRGLDQWRTIRQRPSKNKRVVPRDPAMAEQEDAATQETVDKQIWTEAPDGSITTTQSDAFLFLPLVLPRQFEVEFEVSSSKPLNFVMAIGQYAKNGRRIETWVDVLVAVNGNDFVILQTVEETDLSVHLHLFVDRDTKMMQIYSTAGKKLGEIEADNLLGGSTGLVFRNGDFDLSIRRLRVSHWDGKAPHIVSGDNSRIELNDGTVHFGAVDGFDGTAEALTLLVDGETITIPISEVASIVVSGQSMGPANGRTGAWLNWKDGSFLSGSLVSATDETVIFKTDYATDPIQCNRVNLIQMGLTHLSALASDIVVTSTAEAETANDYSDRIFHKHGTLQGRLVVEGAADAPIQWTPLGGLNASTLQGIDNARFVRALDVRHSSQHADLQIAFPDILYLKNNDVLPCRIEACSEDGIEFTSPFTEVRTFSRKHIRAIELTAAGRIHQSGFGAKGWKGLSTKEKADTGKLEFRGNIHYSHPEILTGDTVRFRLEWPKQSSASLTVSMFGNGRRDDEECTHVCFNIQSNSVQVLERPMQPNQMMMGLRMGGPGRVDKDGLVIVRNPKAEIQLVAQDGNIVVSINGKPAKTIKMNYAAPGRRGIAFNANVTAAGPQVIINGRAQQRNGDVLTLTDFEVDNRSGTSIRQFIEEESRQAALTIPRFRRDNPPTHVLIAQNGDLLRGRMLAIEGAQVVFESRLETLRFDRSRVGAIVWLDAPEKDDATSTDSGPKEDAATESAASTADDEVDGFATDDDFEATMQAQLADGFSITMKPLRLVDGRIEGTSSLLGKCSFPAREVRELYTGDLKNSERQAAYDTWVTRMAREPDWDIPQSDGGNSEASTLIGTTATDFELPMLDGTTFKLSDHRDKIVVLDFWATWCGPCVMALPDYIAATSKFDESKVIFVAVNLQEASDQIRSFLTEKELSPSVALDRGAAVAPTFQVSGIPHTVILGPGNVIEDVHVGYQPGSGETMQTTIQQLLDGTWKRSVEEKLVE